MPATKSVLPIVDPLSIMPTWVDGLSAIQTVGAVTHLIFTVLACMGHARKSSAVVQARLIVPNDQLQAIARALLSGRSDLPYVGEAGEPVEFH